MEYNIYIFLEIELDLYFQPDPQKSGIAYLQWRKKGRDITILGLELRPFRPACYSYEETCPVHPDAACIKCQMSFL